MSDPREPLTAEERDAFAYIELRGDNLTRAHLAVIHTALLDERVRPPQAEWMTCSVDGCDFTVERGEGRTMALHGEEHAVERARPPQAVRMGVIERRPSVDITGEPPQAEGLNCPDCGFLHGHPWRHHPECPTIDRERDKRREQRARRLERAASPPAERARPPQAKGLRRMDDDPDYFPNTEYERGYADGRAALRAEATRDEGDTYCPLSYLCPHHKGKAPSDD